MGRMAVRWKNGLRKLLKTKDILHVVKSDWLSLQPACGADGTSGEGHA